MKFPLERLPRTALVEMFSYINPHILLNQRFLNKSFFNIIMTVIQNHLRYSTYYFKYNPYRNIQQDYIMKNGINVEHIVITSGENLNYITKSCSLDEDFTRFENLKSLEFLLYHGEYESIIATLTPFKNTLYKIESLTISIENECILDEILTFINPNKIKTLNIVNSFSTITINNILNFSNLVNLEELIITARVLDVGSDNLINSKSIIFPSLKTLSIYCYFTSNLKFDMFGDIPKLNSIKIIFPTLSPINVQFINVIELLSNLYSEYHFNGKYEDDINIMMTRMKPLLNIRCIITIGISELGNVPIFLNSDISSTSNMSKVSGDENSSNNSDNSSKYDNNKNEDGPIEDNNEPEILFLNVQVIRFTNCNFEVNFVSEILSYFPNIKKLVFKNCCFLTNNENTFLLNKLNSCLVCVDEETIDNCNFSSLSFFDEIDMLYID